MLLSYWNIRLMRNLRNSTEKQLGFLRKNPKSNLLHMMSSSKLSSEIFFLYSTLLVLLHYYISQIWHTFSLSTLITTTGSVLPTLMSLLMERIRLLDNSESKIMPSILLYSSRWNLGQKFTVPLLRFYDATFPLWITMERCRFRAIAFTWTHSWLNFSSTPVLCSRNQKKPLIRNSNNTYEFCTILCCIILLYMGVLKK